MAILKKPEPKKRVCRCEPPRTASGISDIVNRLADTSAVREEMNKVQLDMMKADLRKHVADAEMAELNVRIARRSNGFMQPGL